MLCDTIPTLWRDTNKQRALLDIIKLTLGGSGANILFLQFYGRFAAKMLDQNFQMGEGYQDCDTTTPQSCITTPFSVKDILNLNIPSGSEYTAADGYPPQSGSNRAYEECYNQSQELQQFWENGYEQYGAGYTGYYGGIEVKTEPCFASKPFGCESVYGVPVSVHQIGNNACELSTSSEVQDAGKDSMVYVKTESPSK